MQYKAIETEYNGFKFRSRLEARWAITFDNLHLPYHYEPEGFDLDGEWYLPDFLLSNEVWVEIKPNLSPDNQGVSKAEKFVRVTKMPIIVCWGDPWYPDWTIGRGAVLYEWVEHEEAPPCIVRSFVNWGNLESVTPEQLHRAYTAARQARFEHRKEGQTWLPQSPTQQRLPKPISA